MKVLYYICNAIEHCGEVWSVIDIEPYQPFGDILVCPRCGAYLNAVISQDDIRRDN